MAQLDITKIKKVYFIGIAGMGMSALARMMKHLGKEVSGSNIEESELLDVLTQEGIPSQFGQDSSFIPADVDLIVYSEAVEDYHSEFINSIREQFAVPVLSYPEMLGEVSRGKFTIAIAGTHGKTTTTGMIGTMLQDVGKKPSMIVGSILAREQSNFIAGSSDIFVVEACEYKRSFLHLHPNILVITNIEEDHMDFYKTIDDIYAAFNELAKSVPHGGYIISSLSGEVSEKVLRGVNAGIIDFTKCIDTTLQLRIPAPYNFQNAAAALAVGATLDIDEQQAKTSLEKFQGTWRRFEYIGEHSSGARVYNDYAHHPTELRAVLEGAKTMFPDKKIITVFEPHLYSRTKALFEEFTKSFTDADHVLLVPIYYAREVADESVSSEMLAREIQKKDTQALYVESYEQAQEYLDRLADNDSVILILGAGPIYRLAHIITK